MQCTFIRTNKQQCRAPCMTGTKLCFRHSPDRVKQALEASQTGGTNRSPSVAFQEVITLKTTKDIQKLIGKVINGVWQGKVPIKVGSLLVFSLVVGLMRMRKRNLKNGLKNWKRK